MCRMEWGLHEMIWENIQLAFSSLISNKMRSLLTMLGIIIGIMSIITIVFIGDAMTASVSDSLSSLGTNNITVSIREKSIQQTDQPDGRSTGRDSGPSVGFVQQVAVSTGGKMPSSEDLISEQMIADMTAYFSEDIQGVSLSYGAGSATVQDGELYANVSVNGVNGDYLLANNVKLLSGRYISEVDLKEKGMTAIVSDKLVQKMFPGGVSPMGQQIRLYRPNAIEIYTIIGVYQYEQNIFAGNMASDENIQTTLYVPLTTAKQDLLEKNFTSITVIGSQSSDVHELTAALQNYFDMVYSNNKTWEAAAFNITSILDAVTETMGTISLAIAFIASISLLVGGIGIMNIMLVSVTERTREIGTRKALGAQNYHIQFQFVMEAVIIALVGGIIGLLLGIGAGMAAASALGVSLVVSPLIVVGSVLFAMVIGVIFGYFPANKAAKLDPIDALRYE